MNEPWYADTNIVESLSFIVGGSAGGALFLRWPNVAEHFYRGFGFRNVGNRPRILGYLFLANVPVGVIGLVWSFARRL